MLFVSALNYSQHIDLWGRALLSLRQVLHGVLTNAAHLPSHTFVQVYFFRRGEEREIVKKWLTLTASYYCITLHRINLRHK